jgi:hypothetical protein
VFFPAACNLLYTRRFEKVLRRLSLYACLLALCALAIQVARAEVPLRYQYQNWGDRWEGIQAGYQVAGERLEIVSAKIIADFPVAESPEKLFLGFFLDRPSKVAITVRLPDDNYWLEPIDETGRKNFAGRPGFNRFSWGARVVRYLRRNARDLHALAVIRRGGQAMPVLPVLLYDSSSPVETLQVDRYEFAFLPNADVDISYRVTTLAGHPLMSDELVGMPAGHLVTIPWEPGGIEDGEYRLVVDAVFPMQDGPPLKPSYAFVLTHRRRITIRD